MKKIIVFGILLSALCFSPIYADKDSYYRHHRRTTTTEYTTNQNQYSQYPNQYNNQYNQYPNQYPPPNNYNNQ